MYKKILFLCINIYKFLIKIKILKVKNMKRMKKNKKLNGNE